MTQSNYVNKAKYWLAVTYPENMIDDWERRAPDILQVPYAYCIHDKDESGHDGDRKTHVHWMLAFEFTNGNTTRKHALTVINLLSKDGRICCPGVEASLNVARSYKYLIHDTETAQADGKHLYDVSERKTGNDFDIDRYITLSTEQKLKMQKDLTDYAVSGKFFDIATYYEQAILNDTAKFGTEYYQVFQGINAQIDRICRANYNRRQRRITAIEAPKCAICGSTQIMGAYRGADGKMWFCADCQETAYRVILENEEEIEDVITSEGQYYDVDENGEVVEDD